MFIERYSYKDLEKTMIYSINEVFLAKSLKVLILSIAHYAFSVSTMN
jgi:hypothetical protein